MPFGADITPISRYTYARLMNDIMMKMKNYSKKDFTNKLTMEEIYRAVLEWWVLQGFKDDPYYRAFDVVPVIARVTSNLNAGASFNATGRVLIIPASGSAITWEGASAFAASFVGAAVRIEVISEVGSGGESEALDAAAAPTNVYNTTIESVTNGTTVVLASTSIPSLSGSAIKVIVTATSEQDEIDLSALTYYKVLSSIIKMKCATTGLCIPVDSATFDNISVQATAADNYSEDVIYYRSGKIIRCRRGGNVSTYGQREIEYVRRPVPPVDANSYVDLPDDACKMVLDMVQLELLETVNKGVPTQLRNSNDVIMQMRKANAEMKQKLKTDN